MRGIGRILIAARQLWPLYVGVVCGAVAISATTLLMPFIIARATDTVIGMVQGGPGTVGGLLWLAVALLAVSLANSVLTNITGYWGDVLAARLRVILSQRYFDKLLRLPLRYYDDELTGTIISRLNRSITAISDFLKEFANAFFPLLLTIGAVLDVVFFAIYAIIFVQTAQGTYSVGVMILLIQLVNMAREPVASMSWLVDTSQRAIAGSREYFTVMDQADEPRNALEAGDIQHVWAQTGPAIELDHVSFRYSEDTSLVLDDITLVISRGERVAFVGESGGGKTTLVNLIMKLYPVTSGQIRVYGEPIDEIPVTVLRREIGAVFQDASLFSGTIRENLAYGRDATDQELAEAVRRANAAGFTGKLKDGLDTEIGERGIKLSGGQKQRISVARALLKDAPILILDEATSSLDTKAERAVQAGLDELMEGRTTLIIAHRLSTISSVDRIVTLRDGRIDEIGSPAELATTGGIYAELLALQGSTRKADKAKLLRYDITH